MFYRTMGILLIGYYGLCLDKHFSQMYIVVFGLSTECYAIANTILFTLALASISGFDEGVLFGRIKKECL